MKRDPGYYDYLPYNKRPKIEWPNGARVAFWVAPNIEFYELEPPKNPTRISWPRPVPDVLASLRILAFASKDAAASRSDHLVCGCRAGGLWRWRR